MSSASSCSIAASGCDAVRCGALQCVAVCCSVLQCVAVCCGVLRVAGGCSQKSARYSSDSIKLLEI